MPQIQRPTGTFVTTTGITAITATQARFPQARSGRPASAMNPCLPQLPSSIGDGDVNAKSMPRDVARIPTDAAAPPPPPPPSYRHMPPPPPPSYRHMPPPPPAPISPPSTTYSQDSSIASITTISPASSAAFAPESSVTTVAFPSEASQPLHRSRRRSFFASFRRSSSAVSGHTAADREIVTAIFNQYCCVDRNVALMTPEVLCRFRRDYEGHVCTPARRSSEKRSCSDCAHFFKLYDCGPPGMTYEIFANFCSERAIAFNEGSQGDRYSKPVFIELACQNLKKTDLIKHGDPFAEIFYRIGGEEGKWIKAARSKVQWNTPSPSFEELGFYMVGNSGQALEEAEIKIEIRDKDFARRSDRIGRLLTSPAGLEELKESSGKVELEDFRRENENSVPEFVGFIRVDDFKNYPATRLS